MSGGIDLDQLPVVFEADGVEIRATGAGDMTMALVRLEKGHDARPLFKGLRDDLCQCPHWGYVIKGTLRVWTARGSDVYRQGQAFYWSPGHAPEALEDTDFLEISPTRALEVMHRHVAGDQPG